MKYYPAFVDLNNRRAVVIGGGKVAERKVLSLLKAGAEVRVISPRITAKLKVLQDQDRIDYIKRSYRKGDLRNAFIVIGATSSRDVNSQIARDAGESLVNIADPPSEGNFIVPSVVKRGPMTIAISTEGASPAVARAIRKELEKNYDKEFALYLGFLEKVRPQALDQIRDKKKREKFLKSLASETTLNLLRTKGFTFLSRKIRSDLFK